MPENCDGDGSNDDDDDRDGDRGGGGDSAVRGGTMVAVLTMTAIEGRSTRLI